MAMNFAGLNTGMPDYLNPRRKQPNDPYGMLQQAQAPSAPSAPAAQAATGGAMPEHLRTALGFGGGQRQQVDGSAVAAAYGVTPAGGNVSATAPAPATAQTAATTQAAATHPKTLPEMSLPDILNRIARKNYQHQQYTWGLLKGILGSLGRDAASGYSPDMQASLIAPGLQSQDEAYKNAAAGLEQNLASRGLGDSSAMTSGLGTLYGNRAAAGSGLVSQLQQRNQDRQDALRSQQSALAAALHSGSQQGMLQAIQGYQQFLMQQKQMDQMGGFDLGGLFGGLGGILGSALGAGGALAPQAAQTYPWGQSKGY